MEDGTNARVVGVHANLPIRVEYGPKAYIEGVGRLFHHVPSLYYYQLGQRLKNRAVD